jgi:D-alanyl-D-alanine carboxypeptidase
LHTYWIPNLDTHPGKGWSYSDTGYLLLGLIIEKATGKDFYEVVYHYFINPLRLENTSPSDRIDLEGLASGYLAPDNDFGLPAKTTHTPGILMWHPGIEWTGGGFISNSQDLAKWFKLPFFSNLRFNYIGKEMIIRFQ